MLSIFLCVYYLSVYLLRRNVCFGLLPTFWLGCLFFWYWAIWAAYKTLEINPLSVLSFAIIFSHSEGCLLILFIVSFAVQRTSLVAQTVKCLPTMQRPGFNPWVGKIPFDPSPSNGNKNKNKQVGPNET